MKKMKNKSLKELKIYFIFETIYKFLIRKNYSSHRNSKIFNGCGEIGRRARFRS